MCEYNQIEIIYDSANEDYRSLVLRSHTCIHFKIRINELQDSSEDFDYIRTGNESSIEIFHNSKRSDDFEFEMLMCLILQNLNIKSYKIEAFIFESLSSSCILMMFVYALKKMRNFDINFEKDNGLKITVNEKVIYSCTAI